MMTLRLLWSKTKSQEDHSVEGVVNPEEVATPPSSDPDMDEAISEFLVESDENLSQVERDLVDMEGSPDEDTLSSIFRAYSYHQRDVCVPRIYQA